MGLAPRARAADSDFSGRHAARARAEPKYKYGVVHLYDQAGAVCLPIALNAGLFWPRRSFWRYPGMVVLEILDPIPPGLDKKAFADRLENDIETATARLIAEAGGVRSTG